MLKEKAKEAVAGGTSAGADFALVADIDLKEGTSNDVTTEIIKMDNKEEEKIPESDTPNNITLKSYS